MHMGGELQTKGEGLLRSFLYKGGHEMDINILILPMISTLLGFYLVCLGLWELRVSLDRKRFITFSFTRLFLIFILPDIFGLQLIYNPQ
jgi:hypothetical protein